MSAKSERYKRVCEQLEELFLKTQDPVSRMATAVSILHNKFDHFYWTGFYRLVDDELVVGPYQGLVACLLLKKHTGVCWTAIDKNESIIVPDVHKFSGHIACDSNSKSEIVIPVRDKNGIVTAVLDVDSTELDSFDKDDEIGLTSIAQLIY
ncbi:MAG: GAF domain-containing protein [Proteobacteria bacterium]|nr:GAF domain-containing protein [Pseudomonadota bacterium]